MHVMDTYNTSIHTSALTDCLLIIISFKCITLTKIYYYYTVYYSHYVRT